MYQTKTCWNLNKHKVIEDIIDKLIRRHHKPPMAKLLCKSNKMLEKHHKFLVDAIIDKIMALLNSDMCRIMLLWSKLLYSITLWKFVAMIASKMISSMSAWRIKTWSWIHYCLNQQDPHATTPSTHTNRKCLLVLWTPLFMPKHRTSSTRVQNTRCLSKNQSLHNFYMNLRFVSHNCVQSHC